MIVHVSNDFNITFKDGYHLFKIVKNNGSSDGKRLSQKIIISLNLAPWCALLRMLSEVVYPLQIV